MTTTSTTTKKHELDVTELYEHFRTVDTERAETYARLVGMSVAVLKNVKASVKDKPELVTYIDSALKRIQIEVDKSLESA